jgi:hypothetical protein
MDGSVASIEELVALIEAQVPEAVGRISFAPDPLPFPVDIDASGLAPLGDIPVTSLATGVADTIARFRRLAAEGRLTSALAGIEPA